MSYLRYILLLLLVFTIAFAARQENNLGVNYIETLIRKYQPEGQIVYTDCINARSLYKVKSALSKSVITGTTADTKQNSITLSRQEKKFVNDQIESFSRPYWNENLFPGSKMIREDESVNYIRKAYEEYSENLSNPSNSDSDKNALVKNYQRPYVFEFSKPIYLRNNSFCLIFVSAVCGSPCGSDELCFYKIENDKWVKWVVAYAAEY